MKYFPNLIALPNKWLKVWNKKIDIGLKYILGACAFVSILTTIAIIVVLSKETYAFFKHVSPIDFLFGTRWEPMLDPQSFGVLPLISGTMLITIGAGLMAIPIGILTGVFLSEFASPKLRSIVKPILEILAGIPTIIYGFFALTFITPILQTILPQTEIFNGLSGAIVVGIMILPMISSLCDDAFQAVPTGLKMGGYALGATSFEVIKGILIPASLSRVLAAVILALSRAIGETMAVTLASGSNPQLTFNPLVSIQTITAYIVQVSLGDIPAGGPAYLTCFAVASILFLITFAMNILAQTIVKRYKMKSAHF